MQSSNHSDEEPSSQSRTGLIAVATSKGGWGAILLFVVAAITFWETSGLKIGTSSSMGPGYFPSLLGAMFVFFGILLLIEGYRNPDERVELGQLGPAFLLLAGIVAFTILLNSAGGAIAIAVLVLISAFADRKRPKLEYVVLVISIVGLVWFVFIFALNMQIFMLPNWLQQ